MSEKTLKDMFKLMTKGDVADFIRSGAEMPDKHTEADLHLRLEAGAECHTYHGCPTCNKHVWTEKDVGNDCPIEGCTGKRRNEKVICFRLSQKYCVLTHLYSFLGCAVPGGDSFPFKATS